MDRVIGVFREEGATSKSKALSLRQLGLPLFLKHLVRSPFGENLPFVEVNGKYYLDEKRAAEIEKLEGIIPGGPFKKWAKHTASVPRGYLRYRVLQLLKEQPMSGSEISSRIEEETKNRWKPSPGSLYGKQGLLNSLETEGVIEELPAVERIKRYKMTELGHAILEEAIDVTETMRHKLESAPLPFLRLQEVPPELESLGDIMRRIFESGMAIFGELCENPDTEVVKELEKTLKRTAGRMEKIVERFESD